LDAAFFMPSYPESPSGFDSRFSFSLIGLTAISDKTLPVFFGEILLKLTINGEDREILNSLTLEELARELDIQAPNFAMALNKQVIPRSKYGTTQIQENDQVEIVHAVGGGI
jgi:sulfur carrier protein